MLYMCVYHYPAVEAVEGMISICGEYSEAHDILFTTYIMGISIENMPDYDILATLYTVKHHLR